MLNQVVADLQRLHVPEALQIDFPRVERGRELPSPG